MTLSFKITLKRLAQYIVFGSSFYTSVLIAEGEKEESHRSALSAYYDEATYIESADGSFKMKAELRFQFRASTPFENNPDEFEDVELADIADASLNRARLKFEGHAYKSWLHYKVEYDLKGSSLLDARMTTWYSKAFGFRLGRYKVNYNPERVTSSKDLQMVERSMVNNYFTLDRQQGVSILGRLGAGSRLDSSYSLGVYSGEGREQENTNDHFLTVARYQWNILGGVMKTAMGDLSVSTKPALHIAVAAASNISPYTSFSSSGGGQLPSFSESDSEFKIKQWMADVHYKYHGFSILAEYHEKDVTDQQLGDKTFLQGFVVTMGAFPYVIADRLPKPLELTARYSTVDPNTQIDKDELSEVTLGANWFYNKHRNKISFDLGNYSIEGVAGSVSEYRYRLQWDISF